MYFSEVEYGAMALLCFIAIIWAFGMLIYNDIKTRRVRRHQVRALTARSTSINQF